MNDLAHLESKQYLSATARGSSFTLGLLSSLFSAGFLIFSLILLSELYFDKGLSNKQKAEKNIIKLNTFVSSSSEHCAQYCTFHTAVSENTVHRDCLLCIQHTKHFVYDHTYLSLFLKSPHCCQ